MLTMSVWDVVPESQWEAHRARLARILNGESLDETFEYEVRDKTGRFIPAEVRSAPYRKGEAILGFQAIARNIQERKRASRALQASEARYRRLFEAAKDGILILDAETGEIDDVNPFLADLVGYSHDELIGKKLWELGPFRDLLASQETFSELKARGYVRYEDLPLQTRDGRTVAVEFVSNTYLVGSEEGRPVQHPRHQRAQARRGGAARERGALPFPVRQLPDRHLPHHPGRRDPGREPGAARHARVRHARRAAPAQPRGCRVPARLSARTVRGGPRAGRARSGPRGEVEAQGRRRCWWCARTRWRSAAADGNVLFYEGAVEDVTERTRAEEARRRLAAAVDQAAEAVVVTDARGRDRVRQPGVRAHHRLHPGRGDRAEPPVAEERQARRALLPRALGDDHRGTAVEGPLRQPAQGRHALRGGGDDLAGARRARRHPQLRRRRARRHA